MCVEYDSTLFTTFTYDNLKILLNFVIVSAVAREHKKY